MSHDVERDYAAAVSPDALERQKEAAKDKHVCCGFPFGSHHPSCTRDQDERDVPPVIEGQQSLL